MRTLQEKYNAVLEGTFSKEQFRRDAVMQLPNLVSKFNSFEDMTTILKNRGMLAEAKKEEVTAYKKPEVDPVDLIAPDLLDDGIKAELEAAGIEGTPSEEEYEKAKEKAAKNLAKDPLCYKNAQTMPEMGEKMEKAKLKEEKNTFLRDQEKLRDELSEPEVAAAVADEPASVGKAFRNMVMQEPEKYKSMSKEELVAAFEEFKANYYIDQEAEQEFDKYAGAPDAEIKEAGDETPKYSEEELAQMAKDQQEHDEETLRRERGLEERQLKEALNKDIRAFGQDLDKAFKAAGFDTLVLMQSATPEHLNIVKTNPKAVLFEVSQTPEAQTLTVRVNPTQIQKAESIINKFQLSDFNGPVLQKGWTVKQVKGAINPGDIVKQDADKGRGMWYFYRLTKVDTKVKTLKEINVSGKEQKDQEKQLKEAVKALIKKTLEA